MMTGSGVRAWKHIDPTGLTTAQIRFRLAVLRTDRRKKNHEYRPHARRVEVLGPHIAKLDELIEELDVELKARKGKR